MWGAWLPVAAYVALIFGASSIPNLAPPGDFSFFDKIAHLLEYGVLGVLLFRALVVGGLRSPGKLILIVLAVGAVVGALDEVYQGTVGRETSLGDWLADSLGSLVAALGGVLVLRRKGKVER